MSTTPACQVRHHDQIYLSIRGTFSQMYKGHTGFIYSYLVIPLEKNVIDNFQIQLHLWNPHLIDYTDEDPTVANIECQLHDI